MIRPVILAAAAVLAAAPATALTLPGAREDATRPPDFLRHANLRALVLRDPAVSATNRALARDYAGARGGIDRFSASYGDLTGDGTTDVVVPLYSGGTAGDIAYFVYAEVGGKVKDIFAVNDTYKVGVTIRSGRLVERTPIYRAQDANCCPSYIRTTVYKWDGSGFKVQARTTSRTRR